jgi:hypothetical protein
LGSGLWDAGARFIGSKEIGPVMAHAMVGYTLVGKDDNPSLGNTVQFGIAL